MSDKVKLPKEVAEAIDHFKQECIWWQHSILKVATEKELYVGDPAKCDAIKVFCRNEYSFAKAFLPALVNGYEVEQTPEDKVREYFLKLVDAGKLNEANAIHFTLDWLGIKISGVNAE